MTREDILKKAIEKAVKNGFKINQYITELEKEAIDNCLIEPALINWQNRHYAIIFSHDFAKSFWKDTGIQWEAPLMAMVISEDPIKYLEQFI